MEIKEQQPVASVDTAEASEEQKEQHDQRPANGVAGSLAKQGEQEPDVEPWRKR
jgi:hypothetical protein